MVLLQLVDRSWAKSGRHVDEIFGPEVEMDSIVAAMGAQLQQCSRSGGIDGLHDHPLRGVAVGARRPAVNLDPELDAA
jgi:hypothetical protein